MAAEQGELAIPDGWVHGDLQRLRLRMESHDTADRLSELQQWRDTLFHRTDVLEKSTQQLRQRVGRLSRELAEATAQLESDSASLESARRLLDGSRNQTLYQKSTSRSFLVPSAVLRARESADSMPPSLSPYAFSALPLCVGNAAPPDDEAVAEFLKRCAPLFQWSSAEQLVQRPYFFDEPCLMERAAAEATPAGAPPSPSAAASTGTDEGATGTVECRSAACAYWHANQLAHVKLAAHYTVEVLQRLCSAAERQRCCVALLLARLSRRVNAAESVSAVCALVCEALQIIVSVGLYRHFASGREAAVGLTAPPLLHRADVQRAMPTRVALLVREEERECWSTLMERHAQQPNLPVTAAAAALVQERVDALTWRCLLATVADASQRRWLARQGTELFPNCPQLHSAYVLSCIHDGADARGVMGAALDACRTLSAQAAAAVVAGLDCGQYPSAVARHAAHMLAVAFVRYAAVDAQSALSALLPLLAEEGGRDGDTSAVMLLPVARQNLALMAVAVRRGGRLRCVEALPLAAISDVVFELSPPDGANPADSGRDALYASLKLVGSCRDDHFDAQLTHNCSGALQLSLLRTFSHRLPFMERVAEKTVPESALAQALLYGEYVSAIAQHQSVPAAVQAAAALAASEKPTCTLLLLLSAQLQVWGVKAELGAAQAVDAFCAAVQFPAEGFSDAQRLGAAIRQRGEVPVVEWVAAQALHVRYGSGASSQGDGDAWAAMAAFPVELLVSDTAAAALHFHVLLHLCGAALSTTNFYETVRRCLSFFREAHTRLWSPLDAFYEELVGLPHYVSLLLYAEVPFVLGAAVELTHEWRCLVLAAAAELGVLHPLLQSSDSAA